MKKHLFIIILLFSSCMYCQNNTISWSADYKLTWDDFQATTDSSNYGQAKTSYSIQIIPKEVEVDLEERILDYKKMTVRADFQKNLSWSMAKFDTIVLNHEQVHFDIAELYARKIRKQFHQNITAKESQYSKYWNDYKKLWKECTDFQQRFDSETNHGRNFGQNKIWRKMVNDQLKDLREFQ